MSPLAALVLLSLAAPAAPSPEVIAVDLAATPFAVTGAVRAFAPTDARAGQLDVRLVGSMLPRPGRYGELRFNLRKTALRGRRWNNAAEVTAEVRVAPVFVGEGKRNWHRAHRGRLFVEDARGRRLYLPNHSLVDRPQATGGWLPLHGGVTADVPMPLGHTDTGFDPAAVVALGVNVEAFHREGEVAEGIIELRDLRVTFTPPVTARVLPPNPAVRAGEAARAARMEARLRERCGVGRGQLAVGVNLAWPTAVAPTGDELQLYGRLLDGGNERWWNRTWDLGDAAVAKSVRTDFQEIRETFGPGAVVRLWIFGDGRTGLMFDAAGDPVGVTERARTNMAALLKMAVEEQVVLMPSLLDFGLADGVAKSGPNGAWAVGERPELVTDPAKRAKLVKVIEDFVRPFAGHPAVLAWDVMNEPGNAAGVVTPAHFADLQALVAALVDAVHRAGDLATVGHRNADEPARFWRGREASDLGHAHYYPLAESRPNPTPFGVRMTAAFGPLPAGWGELQAIPGQIGQQLETARRAGHRLFLFWSWRGHQETGDGFAVRPYADEIRRALAKQRGRAREN